MDISTSFIIREYLFRQRGIFTVDEFQSYLKKHGVKLNKTQATDVLHTSNFVFSLVNNEYVSRTGVFTGLWFSFKPSKEEIEKNAIILGHRCMPFVNPETSPDSYVVMRGGKEIESGSTVFSMNLALDIFALFGEGYVLPYIINDKSNNAIPLTSVKYNLPSEIELTSWPLDKITDGETFEYGDRILCRVVDWQMNKIEMLHIKDQTADLVVSRDKIERENWYSDFENGLIESFDKNGPANSIEEQLAFLFLEHQEELCIQASGSVEEFLAHTKKIGFSPYGVESRIWYEGQTVPYIGKWNQDISDNIIFTELSVNFTVEIIDAYIEDYIYRSKNESEVEDFEEVVRRIFPKELNLSESEQKAILLNIEQRHAILEKEYNQFSDYSIAPTRKKVLKLFTDICVLLYGIGGSGIKVENFPQQELIILTQLFSHIVHLLEEIENDYLRPVFPKDDVELSLEGMQETFDDIRSTLKSSLETNKYKGFELLK